MIPAMAPLAELASSTMSNTFFTTQEFKKRMFPFLPDIP
ncbi:hypothetical protein CHCC14816_3583 [Bacillus licheniformis]|nr:hypothetical protein CHCC15292_2690 [Bacillus licheniformis]TWM43149.1 hypothetical protein CHCC14816_3583 [Bacillus licheniformis]TWM67229.1 hypothetical protein CHCC14814_3049 [Bacillus paralicheniformis]TWN12133.1 hypothetical protein CHCC14561_1745 [Bacillus licheniformis]